MFFINFENDDFYLHFDSFLNFDPIVPIKQFHITLAYF
jgi:hypothetical protein